MSEKEIKIPSFEALLKTPGKLGEMVSQFAAQAHSIVSGIKVTTDTKTTGTSLGGSFTGDSTSDHDRTSFLNDGTFEWKPNKDWKVDWVPKDRTQPAWPQPPTFPSPFTPQNSQVFPATPPPGQNTIEDLEEVLRRLQGEKDLDPEVKERVKSLEDALTHLDHFIDAKGENLTEDDKEFIRAIANALSEDIGALKKIFEKEGQVQAQRA